MFMVQSDDYVRKKNGAYITRSKMLACWYKFMESSDFVHSRLVAFCKPQQQSTPSIDERQFCDVDVSLLT